MLALAIGALFYLGYWEVALLVTAFCFLVTAFLAGPEVVAFLERRLSGYEVLSAEKYGELTKADPDRFPKGVKALQEEGLYWLGLAKSLAGLSAVVTVLTTGFGLEKDSGLPLKIAILLSALGAIAALGAEASRIGPKHPGIAADDVAYENAAKGLKRRHAWTILSGIFFSFAIVAIVYIGLSKVA